MEKLPVVSFALILTVSVLGVSCDGQGQCKSLFQNCTTDSDCCSQNCHRTFYLFNKRCISPITVLESVKHIFVPKIDHVICERMNTTGNLTRRSPIDMYASHDELPIETRVTVSYDELDVTVQINGRPARRTNGERFYLSERAALMLGIREGALVPCEIRVPVLENNHILRNILYVLPVSVVLAGLCALYYTFTV